MMVDRAENDLSQVDFNFNIALNDLIAWIKSQIRG